MVTNLKDAKALKKMGAPLNTPVEHREFSKEYSKHWFALMKAYDQFMLAVGEYADDDSPLAGTPGMWRLLRGRLRVLDRTAKRCSDAAPKLHDENERALLGFFLSERALPIPAVLERCHRRG
jgi:hypothetical protein